MTEKIARSTISGLSKASRAINIATVNPIPAALPVANRSRFLTPCGYSAIFIFFAP